MLEGLGDAERDAILTNLSRLLLVVLPFSTVLLALRDARLPDASDGIVGLAVLYYVGTAIPILVGGVAHNLLMVQVGRRARVRKYHWALASPVVLIGVVMTASGSLLWDARFEILVALTIYALLIRIPDRTTTTAVPPSDLPKSDPPAA